MLMMLDSLVFVAAAGASAYAIGATIAPNWTRIADALAGRPQPSLPVEPRVRAQRRAAVRRWSTSSAAAVRLREAA